MLRGSIMLRGSRILRGSVMLRGSRMLRGSIMLRGSRILRGGVMLRGSKMLLSEDVEEGFTVPHQHAAAIRALHDLHVKIHLPIGHQII